MGQVFLGADSVAVWLMGVSLGITDIYDPISGSGRGGHRDRVGTLKCSYQSHYLSMDVGVMGLCVPQIFRNSFKHQDRDWGVNLSLPTWLDARQGVETNPKLERKTQFCHISNISKLQEKMSCFFIPQNSKIIFFCTCIRVILNLFLSSGYFWYFCCNDNEYQ